MTLCSYVQMKRNIFIQSFFKMEIMYFKSIINSKEEDERVRIPDLTLVLEYENYLTVNLNY